MSDYVKLDDVTLAYGDVVAVPNLSFEIGKGELIALLGPSGCGKTTTMRAIAGLMGLASGSIHIDGRDVTNLPPSKREVGLVFQSYALFPHLSVYENVAFGLKMRGEKNIKPKVEAAIESVGLSQFANRLTPDLSGGQQQRVSLARSLVVEPKVLLLDEPLSNLDARLRLEMQMVLKDIQKRTGVTMIFVTHDQSEALALADRIVLMKDGKIVQSGLAEDMYNAPETRFAADFFGFENILPGEDGRERAWRPNAIRLGEGPYEGRIRGMSFGGDYRTYVIETDRGQIKGAVAADLPAYAEGETVRFDLPMAQAVALQAG
ncbi:ABC transporter ATP-binding protein [Thalassorhabdomicrobium marinisediminis]|uniref:ABC transporter ATP-binding protein n=1 Tax=Thalassorhabdomicrobium marinisediminis TaxID=2170577 RepID=A0A2T7FX81_9RHOB|nr:ABC transporter ATP-binding protein [Thalassorhabdomicrobium marinisediminis]PVA06781.1 ABC transporter ATP-binding protein [Thalassorhabdomicrobium marinisediminis]